MKPLHVSCFGRHFTLAFFMAGAFFLSSCQRAADEKTKVSITLPNNSKLSTQSISYTTPVVVDDSNESKDSFLDIVPSTNVNSKYPVNCYAIVVGGPEQEFKSSFCGRRDKNNNLSHDIDFGPYQALVPITDTSSPTFDFEVSAGADRQFYVIGLHATNIKSCRDINDSPEKYNLSHPYLLGSSGLISLKGGVDTSVNIKLADPQIGDAKFFDDCIVARDDLKFPLANNIRFEPTFFSETYIRNPASSYYTCEAVDLSLRSLGSGQAAADFTDFALGTVNDETAAHINVGGSVAMTYNNAGDCANDTNAMSVFYFERNDTKKRQWLRLPFSPIDTRILSASLDLPSGTISTAAGTGVFSNISENPTMLLDTAFPRKVQANKCYKVTSYYISGDSSLASTNSRSVSFDTTTLDNSSAGAEIYATSSDCTSDTNRKTSTSIGFSNTNAIEYYLRTSTSGKAFKLKVQDSVSTIVPSSNRILIGTSTDDASNSISRVSTLGFWGRSYLSAASGCVPLHVQFSNVNGSAVPANGAGTVVYDKDQSKSADIAVYSTQADCTASSNELGTANPINFSQGDLEEVFFIKVTSATADKTKPRGLIFNYTENGQASIISRYNLDINTDGY